MHAKADPRLLRIALENLLGNAWKFTRDSEVPHIEFGVADSDAPVLAVEVVAAADFDRLRFDFTGAYNDAQFTDYPGAACLATTTWSAISGRV